MIRVLVADDHAAVRLTMAEFLAAAEEIELAGQAADGSEAVALCAELEPDVVVMDVRMPALNGIEAARAIKAARPSTRIVLVTAYEEDVLAGDAARAGADALLLKGFSGAELVASVREGVACAS